MPLDATTQELFRALFDHSPLPQWIFDRETLRFLAVNEQMVRTYGWSREELLAMTILDIRPSEDVEVVRRRVRLPPNDPAGRRGVWQHRTRTGAVLDIEVQTADVLLGGRPARLVTARDVTSERRAIAALQHNEQRFRAILENSRDALVLQSADGRPIWASSSTANIFGRPPEELVGRQGLELVHPDDRDAVRAARAESLARPFEQILCMARYALAGQPWRWLETVRENRLDDPAVGAIVLHVRDVTEQKLAEEALQRSEQSFRTAIECSPDLVVVIREGLIAYANPAAVHALGEQGADTLVGRPALEFVPPEELAQATKALVDAASGERYPLEIHLRRPDGSAAAHVEFRGASVVFDGGPAVLVFGRDVSERRRLEARLALTDRMSSLGTLAAGIAHEINNPVSYALANVSYVAGAIPAELGTATPQERQELRNALDDARQGLERVRDIVRDLKTFSRGDDEEELGAVELRGVLDAACSMSSNEVKHRARLVRHEGHEPVWVRGNEGKLAQVFVNLLVNAAQAIPDGEASANEVRITVKRMGETVAVEVRDSGCGIPPELVQRLFDPFFTTKPKGVGTGLGLAICHSIVRGHGGAIEVESTPGRGSCFRVLLVATAPAAASAEAAPARSPIPGAVLVVDDEPRVCEAVARLLRGSARVRSLSQSRAALDLIRNGARFDVILCDVMMPEMTGVQLHAAVEAVAPEQARRFAFMTGGVFSHEARRLLAATGRPVLEKPFDRDQLLACLRAVAEPVEAAGVGAGG